MSTAGSANSIFDQVLSFTEHTSQPIFLTGKAGTGKTTLLRQIREKSTKKLVVIAPTGVAAMNAKGTTINSFFQLPNGSFFPGDISLENLQSGMLSIQSIVADLSFSREKTALLNELGLLIIDEISMVRCDQMDVMDAILRAVRKNNRPFGGVQLLLIGDLYQLPPVTKREDWTLLGQVYPSPYFFDSRVIRSHPVLQIELTRVFRQTEPEFVNILNAIRNNRIGEAELALLNQRYDPDFKATGATDPIIITSHNAEANAVNKARLDELPGLEYTFNGETSGDFRDAGIQAEQSLKLKEGAQVMFIKNDTGEDRKFYNGKIGRVKSIQADQIYIAFPAEEDLLLEKTSWQSFEYKTDHDEMIVQQQVGEFSQYPVKLAWAVTIHKSQGLTFDSAVIDAGKSFIAGQVYVALSRVRTLDGLILKSKINTESLRSSPEVIRFMKPATGAELDRIMVFAQEQYILDLVIGHFNFNRLLTGLDTVFSNPEVVKSTVQEYKTQELQLKKTVAGLMEVAEKFRLQLSKLHREKGFQEQQLISERIASAAVYFKTEISSKLIGPVNKNIRIKPKNKLQQQVQHLFQKYRQLAEHALFLLDTASGLLDAPLSPENYTAWIDLHQAQPKIKSGPAASGPSSTTLQLF